MESVNDSDMGVGVGILGQVLESQYPYSIIGKCMANYRPPLTFKQMWCHNPNADNFVIVNLPGFKSLLTRISYPQNPAIVWPIL